MAEQKKYWRSLEERDAAAPAADEFAEPVGLVSRPFARRDFLKAAGFTAALATLSGCSRAPVQKAIPFLLEPEELVPGRALYYASTCGGCSAGCGVLVKNRDGRPIKLEGNPQQPLTRGGLCAVGQGSILGLYDSQRLKQPMIAGKATTWEEVDRQIGQGLRNLRGGVRFLSGTITSPTLRAAIGNFLKQFPDAQHISYDVLSASAVLDAHEQTHGARVLPHYRFDKADVIVGCDADFLGMWISPVEFAADYAAGRRLIEKRLSYHVQFEPRMSLTGTKADRRFAVAPGEMGLLLTYLAARVAGKAGAPFTAELDPPPVEARFLDDLADRLWAARGRSLVVCGTNDMREQLLVNYLNHLLGNYGATLDVERPSYQRAGNDRALASLLEQLNAGKIGALFVLGANPAYDLPVDFAAAMKRVPVIVSFAERMDETAALAQFVCPDRHYLESWSDAEPVAGTISVMQPVIRPLGQTRSVVESLAAWSGKAGSQHDLVRASWQKEIFPRQKAERSFDAFWDKSVHDGFAEMEQATKLQAFNVAAVRPIRKATRTEMAVVLYAKPGMLDGRHAYNPFLQELPDPVTKATWDNYACLAPATASRLQLRQGDMVRIDAGGKTSVELPVYLQAGQHDRVVAVALGYGSKLSARFANLGPRWIDAQPSVGANGLVGVNAAPLLVLADGALRNWQSARLTKTGSTRELASTQTHNTLTVPPKLVPPDGKQRPIVQETTLAAYLRDPHTGVEDHEEKEDLWPADHPYPGPRWGMVVDLNACTGCSACVVACQVENNIPVVGRDETRRNREMHWLRIDRYYSEQDGEVGAVHQPMICQQCENAPCETVCPVLATVHSEDGLNQQVYNRCVGTRYCANNCPYKARRFNWFAYAHDDTVENLLLNPDVAVRTRGVMEKCTFCVQRIQEAKIAARAAGDRLADGAVQTACQQSCPAGAIIFGDLNDSTSRVSRAMADPRRYRVLSELNVRPAVGYKSVVRNRPEPRSEVNQGNSKEDHHG